MSFKLTVLIHIDALRYDYITSSDMPFLFSLGKSGITGSIIPPFGFEPDGAYLTGTYPEVYEGGMHFIYKGSNGGGIPFSLFMPAFLDHLHPYIQFPIRRFFQWLVSSTVSTTRIKKQPFIGQIPFAFLRYFDYCEKYSNHEPNFSPSIPTIFDYCRKRNVEFFYHGFPEYTCNAEEVSKRVIQKLLYDQRLVYLLIADLDKVGHESGPDSAERHIVCRKIDSVLRDIYEHVKRKVMELDFIVFGDHGMCNVTYCKDFRPIIKSLPFKHGRDFIYFLDSTFARFWVFNHDVERKIVEELSELKCGSMVTEQDRIEYHINYKNRKFGDIIFWLDEGWMIFPNFWHVRKHKKGMHGYRKEAKNNHAAFVFHSINLPSVKLDTPIIMQDLFQTIMVSLFGEKATGSHIVGSPLQETMSGT